MSFKFLPSYKSANSPNSPWTNASWIMDTEYTFTNLRPYNVYNLTVYVQNAKTNEIYPPSKFFSAKTAEGGMSVSLVSLGKWLE